MPSNTTLSKDEIDMYSRQIRMPEIGKEGQMKIKGASVLVVGAGALGCPVLQYLTAAGVGTLGIVDNDWIDETNLNRQVLYSVNDIGKPKPLAAKEKLKLLNPEVSFKVHFIRLDKVSALKVISQYDIIVDCTDNFSSRYLINDASVILKKPVVYGAIHKFSGQIMVLNYQNGPTLRCIYPEPPHPLEVPSCDEAGVIGPIAGIIGSFQASEVIKIILEKGDVLSGKLLIIDSLNFRTQIVSFERNPASSDILELGDYDDDCLSDFKSIRELSCSDIRKMQKKGDDFIIINLQEDSEKKDIGFDYISIPYYEIHRNIDFLLTKSKIIFYCTNGVKSMNVISYLQKVHNMENLYNLLI